jgi:hypothetical protein
MSSCLPSWFSAYLSSCFGPLLLASFHACLLFWLSMLSFFPPTCQFLASFMSICLLAPLPSKLLTFLPSWKPTINLNYCPGFLNPCLPSVFPALYHAFIPAQVASFLPTYILKCVVSCLHSDVPCYFPAFFSVYCLPSWVNSCTPDGTTSQTACFYALMAIVQTAFFLHKFLYVCLTPYVLSSLPFCLSAFLCDYVTTPLPVCLPSCLCVCFAALLLAFLPACLNSYVLTCLPAFLHSFLLDCFLAYLLWCLLS